LIDFTGKLSAELVEQIEVTGTVRTTKLTISYVEFGADDFGQFRPDWQAYFVASARANDENGASLKHVPTQSTEKNNNREF
jgi:hypothetical protein